MLRLWQPCTRRPAADVPAGAHKIRMVSYNILADKYSRWALQPMNDWYRNNMTVQMRLILYTQYFLCVCSS
jgi:hypothetical protein